MKWVTGVKRGDLNFIFFFVFQNTKIGLQGATHNTQKGTRLAHFSLIYFKKSLIM